MKKKYLDESYLKECHTCLFIYDTPSVYFSKDKTTKSKLCKICKSCDKKRIKLKYAERAYFNIPIRCITCNNIFFASKGILNRGNVIHTNDGKYCSLACVIPGGFGRPWNGQRRGANNPNCKYSEETIRKAKLLIKHGASIKEIAKTLSIGRTTLSKIKNNKRWSHIEI